MARLQVKVLLRVQVSLTGKHLDQLVPCEFLLYANIRFVRFTRQGTPTPISPDFSNLQAQWATLSPTGVASSAYASSASGLTPPACPAPTPTGWNIDANAPLPTLGQTLVTPGTPGTPSGNTTSNTAS